MTTYSTGNPIGSQDPRDLYDNAENLDTAINTEADQWTDRLGRMRVSMAGIVANAENEFSQFLVEQGIQELGLYEDGPYTITAYNQAVVRGDYSYRLSTSVDLPYTTAGTDDAAWASESASFVQINYVTQGSIDRVTQNYQSADANLQAQISGGQELEASAFSAISWHDQVIENSVVIPPGKNAWSFGPSVEIAEGQAVEVGAGSFWTIADGEVIQ